MKEIRITWEDYFAEIEELTPFNALANRIEFLKRHGINLEKVWTTISDDDGLTIKQD